jgi:hypothetical protein
MYEVHYHSKTAVSTVKCADEQAVLDRIKKLGFEVNEAMAKAIRPDRMFEVKLNDEHIVVRHIKKYKVDFGSGFYNFIDSLDEALRMADKAGFDLDRLVKKGKYWYVEHENNPFRHCEITQINGENVQP